MTRVLLIEDEPGLVRTLTDRLEAEGYVVAHAADGDTGFARASEEAFDVLLLDVMLPGRDGFAVCRDLRARGVTTPILMLTARGQLTDKVVGLKLGADDYLTKPFQMPELLARLEALLRRSGERMDAAPDRFRFGDVAVDFDRAEVARNGEHIDLSAKEFRLLRHFVEHRGRLVTRDEALTEVWGYDDATPTTRTVDVHVAWLRQKLEPNPRHPRYFVTIHGLGYKFIP